MAVNCEEDLSKARQVTLSCLSRRRKGKKRSGKKAPLSRSELNINPAADSLMSMELDGGDTQFVDDIHEMEANISKKITSTPIIKRAKTTPLTKAAKRSSNEVSGNKSNYTINNSCTKILKIDEDSKCVPDITIIVSIDSLKPNRYLNDIVVHAYLLIQSHSKHDKTHSAILK